MESLSKRLHRMDRWLKRCAVACKRGSWSAALAEMECLEAESREFRNELWEQAEADATGEPVARQSFRARVLASTAIAVAFILAVGFPISMDGRGSYVANGSNPKDELVWVSRTESDVLAALRESLSNNNEGHIVLTLDRADPQPKTAFTAGPAVASERTATASRKPQVLAAAKPTATAASPAKEASEPSVEEVISLIQVGQRALRTSEPAIKIVD